MKGVGESELREVTLSRRIKALVVLNLQSYGGGRDVFGLDSSPEALEREGFQTPIFNDGHLEARPLVNEHSPQHLREHWGNALHTHHARARIRFQPRPNRSLNLHKPPPLLQLPIGCEHRLPVSTCRLQHKCHREPAFSVLRTGLPVGMTTKQCILACALQRFFLYHVLSRCSARPVSWLRQVVGLKGLLHTGVVLSGKTKMHGVRLAQGSEIKLELRAATSASRAVPWRNTRIALPCRIIDVAMRSAPYLSKCHMRCTVAARLL